MESDELIGATVAVYPLRAHPDATIHGTIAALEATGAEVVVGPMTTLVTGTADQVFSALRHAYDVASSAGDMVMTVTVSNACPITGTDDDADASS